MKKTRNYNEFKYLEGNRELDGKHIARLKESIKQHNMLEEFPIIVDENMRVLDGQHRLQACKELGIDVPYKVMKKGDISSVIKINTTHKNWSVEDYLNLYSDLGELHYKTLREFIRTNGITITGALIILSPGANSGKTYKMFKEGRWYPMTSYSKGEELIRQLKEIKEYYPGAFKRSFILAIKKCNEVPEYEHEELISKLKFKHRILTEGSTSTDYLKMLEDIYNWKRRVYVRLI